jgi:hypothetical protein
MTTIARSLLDTFAETHRLRIVRDAYNERIIAGKRGSLITEYGAGRLSVLLLCPTPRRWNGRRRTLIAAGCRLEQDGETEGSLSFEPSNALASKLAVQVAGCKRVRQMSPAQTAALTVAREKSPLGKAVPAARNDDRPSAALCPFPR